MPDSKWRDCNNFWNAAGPVPPGSLGRCRSTPEGELHRQRRNTEGVGQAGALDEGHTKVPTEVMGPQGSWFSPGESESWDRRLVNAVSSGTDIGEARYSTTRLRRDTPAKRRLRQSTTRPRCKVQIASGSYLRPKPVPGARWCGL